ncbi:MAG TPA: hypothetical protein VM282_27435 [Acidimicrobiales bacterium]|nr:hypothetical protein [Acidimicrobiales bacterium]
MAEKPELITATALDAMSPDERAAAVRAHIVTDLDELPTGFRQRVVATGAPGARARGTCR